MLEIGSVVKLRNAIDRYPEGSEGVIVAIYAKPISYMIEIGYGPDRMVNCFEDDLEIVI